MELPVIVMLCITLTMLLLLPAPCVSQDLQKLPRKLKPLDEAFVTTVPEFAGPEFKSQLKNNGHHVSSADQKKQESVQMQGTWREWMEGDRSEYYTMDYAFIRRRRPIHNKSLQPHHHILP